MVLSGFSQANTRLAIPVAGVLCSATALFAMSFPPKIDPDFRLGLEDRVSRVTAAEANGALDIQKNCNSVYGPEDRSVFILETDKGIKTNVSCRFDVVYLGGKRFGDYGLYSTVDFDLDQVEGLRGLYETFCGGGSVYAQATCDDTYLDWSDPRSVHYH